MIQITKLINHTLLLFPLLCVIALVACKSEATVNTNTIANNKIDNVISCTSNGLTVADSTLYMHGGGSDYKRTLVNQGAAPPSIAAGMVWIPGGEFSMGGVNPVGMNDGGNDKMNDARPVH